MIRFSVKKPLTVFVAVIAVLVLGAVAFLRMTPDLLPNMDMPYVLIMTVYPGASPEKVETIVTKPLEQAMATLENIVEIGSTSSENQSVITLEFNESVNMDTISVDILQRVNQIREYWDETVSEPYILKINPSMLPILVAAVEMEGMDTKALSVFVEDQLLGKLEGISGVASISTGGIVEEELSVVISQSKLDSLNKRIELAIDRQFDDSEEELNDAREQAEDGLVKIADAKAEIQNGLNELNSKTAQAQQKIYEEQRRLLEGKAQILDQLELIEQNLAEVESQENRLLTLQNTVSGLENASSTATESISQLESIQTRLAALEAQKADFDTQIESINSNSEITEEEKTLKIAEIQNGADYTNMQAGFAEADAQLAARGIDRDGIQGAILLARAAQSAANSGLRLIDSTLAGMGMDRSGLTAAVNEVTSAKEQLIAGKAQLETMLAELDNGELLIEQAMSELNRQKSNAQSQLSAATNEILANEGKLNAALEEIDAGQEQLDEARQEAQSKVNIKSMITMDMISVLLRAQNFFMPAGYIESGNQNYLVTVGDAFSSTQEVAQLMIFDLGLKGLDPILLKDVADIEITDNRDEIYAKIDGNDGVLLTFTKQSTHATASVSENIRSKFAQLSESYPGLGFVSLMDQGDYIYLVINTIIENLLLGALFAIIVLFLFLRDLRPTFITLCSIPISVIFAIALMYFSGVTINIISLSGLAVAVGMLVDNSVVVIENIYRLRGKNLSPIQAAVLGARQVAAAITSSTLTTVCVFLPIVFVEGITRELFTDMALTVGYALVASLIVALTLVPAMSAEMLKKIKPDEGKLFAVVLSGYKWLVTRCLEHKAVVIVFSLALLATSGIMVYLKGFSFMPDMSMTQITVELEMPELSEFEQTKEMADEVAGRIRSIPEVETVGAMAGVGANSFMGAMSQASGTVDSGSATMYVLIYEDSKRTSAEIGNEIERLCSDLDCVVTASGSSSDGGSMSMLGDSGVSVNIYGENLDQLRDASREVMALFESVEGAVEVTDGMENPDPELRITVDKEKAMREGLTVAQVYQEVAEAVSTETGATNVTYEGRSYGIVTKKDGQSVLEPSDLRSLLLEYTDQEGNEKSVKLGSIAEITRTETLSSINRLEQRRYITVSAAVEEGYNVTLVTNECARSLSDYELPGDISYEFTGENETIMESFYDLGAMLMLGILLVYLIMVSQFQSLKSPFIVMFTIPLAFTGGLLALLISGLELSVIALIGFVMLVGIIVNNGIVLVEFINQLREEGISRREAIIEAGVTRMRPILMTSITTILGLSVMAVSGGMGSELMQPVAIVCIGGLIYATLMTLFVIPVIYDIMCRKELRVVRDEDIEVFSEDNGME